MITLQHPDPTEAQERDALTGLLGRATLAPLTNAVLAQAHERGEPVGMIVLDCDHFKSVNDAFGHQRGDAVLAEIARRIGTCVRQQDRVFRYGGDEFAVLLPHADAAQTNAVVQRILTTIRATPFGTEPPLQLSVSAGAAIYPSDGLSFESLFGIADSRHYAAKRAGRDRAVTESGVTPLGNELAPPSRLIERDTVLHGIALFVQQLGGAARGVLRLDGPPGAGHTRALEELRHAAEMQGFATLTLRGTPALRQRIYGAFSEALREVPAFHTPPVVSKLPGALRDWLADKRGMIFLLDNVSQIDPATIALLQQLYADQTVPCVGYAVAADSVAAAPLPPRADISATLTLAPLTLAGLRTWARQSLHAEISDALADWLLHASAGLPSRFWRALCQLHAAGHLTLVRRQVTCLTFPPLPLEPPGAPDVRLPDGLSELVGRVDELRSLLELTHTHRLVALVGPGGLGKTRLSIQVGAEHAERTGEDVCFVPLAAAQTLDRVVPTIGAALGIGNLDAPGALGAVLRDRPLLLIMDNLEHLPGIDAVILDLLAHAPGLRVLLTSRERPALEEAVIVGLPGLPGGTGDLLIEDSAAAQLLLQRVRKLNPTFAVSADDATHITRICRLVDGMPLAIELAAPWLLTSSCAAVADQLAANVLGLADGSGRLSEHHRTIEAVVVAFWQRLSPGERAMLRRLGVFVGGFDATLANEVALVSPFFLNALVLSGYVRRTPAGRYEIHELLRQYAAAQLRRASRDRAATEARYAAYFGALLHASGDALLRGGPGLEPLRANNENLIAAWRWNSTHRQLEGLQRMAVGFARYMEMSGQVGAGSAVLAETLRWLRPLALEPMAAHSTLKLYCQILTRQMWLLDLHTDLVSATAEIVLAEAAELAARTGDPEVIGAVLLAQASHFLYADPRQVRPLVERLLALPVPARMRAEALRFDGSATTNFADAPRWENRLTHALTLFQEIGDRLGEMRTLLNLAFLACESGQLSQVRVWLQAVEGHAEQLGDTRTAVFVHLFMADLAAELGDWSQAEPLYHACAAACRRYGYAQAEQMAWMSLTAYHCWRADPVAALRVYETHFNDTTTLLLADNPVYHLTRGEMLLALGRLDAAEGAIADASAQLVRLPFPELRARLNGLCASIALRRSDHAQAHTYADLLAEVLLSDIRGIPLCIYPLYVSCAEILLRQDGPRAAAVIAAGQKLLRSRLAGLTDRVQSDRYLNFVRERWPVLV